MSLSSNFLAALDRLKFPGTKNLSTTDFDHLLNNDVCRSVMESVCNMDESCFVTSLELAEYAALSENEIALLENELLLHNQSTEKDESDDEAREEEEFLQEYLGSIEEQNALLQKERELLKSKYISLVQEKEDCQTVYAFSQRRNNHFLNQVSDNHTELVSYYESATSIIKEMNFMKENQNLWCISQKNLEGYFDDEKKIRNLIQGFLQGTFELKHNFKDFYLKVPGYSRKEIQNLHKAIKDSKTAEIEALCMQRMLNAKLKFNETQSSSISDDFDRFSIRNLEQMKKERDNLQENVNHLLSCVSYSINEYTDAQFKEVDSLITRELLEMYEKHNDNLQFFLDLMLDQRTRLEALFACIQHNQRTFEEVKRLVTFVKTNLMKEILSLIERKANRKNHFSKKYVSLDDHCKEAIGEILRGNLCKDADDLLRQVEIYETRNRQEDATLQSMCSQALGSRHLLLLNPQLPWSDARLLPMVNGRTRALADLQGLFEEAQAKHDTDRKFLDRHPHEGMARKLFVYAMINRNMFNDLVDQVKMYASAASSLPSLDL